MQIVDRNLKLNRSLSSDERALIIANCDQSLNGRDTERANRLLRSVRQENLWLVCDCIRPAPIMHVALLDSGTLVLRNNPGTHDHADGCSCGRSTQASGASKSKSVNIVRFDRSDQIALHIEFSSPDGRKVPQISKLEGDAGSGPKKRILSILLTLCDDAGLNVYDPSHPVSLTEQFSKIRDAAQRYTLSNGVPLSSVMDTKIDMPRMIRLGKRISAMDNVTGRPMGLLFDRVASAKSRMLSLLDGKTLKFFGHVERYGPVTEPLLAMATVTTQQPKSHFFELGHVALIPSVSERHLFPVGTQSERKLVSELMGLVDWLYKKGVIVSLQRHLFANSDQPALFLKGRDRVISVLIDDGIGSDVHPAPASPNTITIVKDQDLGPIKRRIAGIFMDAAGIVKGES